MLCAYERRVIRRDECTYIRHATQTRDTGTQGASKRCPPHASDTHARARARQAALIERSSASPRLHSSRRDGRASVGPTRTGWEATRMGPRDRIWRNAQQSPRIMLPLFGQPASAPSDSTHSTRRNAAGGTTTILSASGLAHHGGWWWPLKHLPRQVQGTCARKEARPRSAQPGAVSRARHAALSAPR